MTRIYLLRHGQTQFNQKNVFKAGRCDCVIIKSAVTDIYKGGKCREKRETRKNKVKKGR